MTKQTTKQEMAKKASVTVTGSVRPMTVEDRSRVATLLARTYGKEGVKAIELFGLLRRQDDFEKHLHIMTGGDLPEACAIFQTAKVGKADVEILAQLGLNPADERTDFAEILEIFMQFAAQKGRVYVLLHGFAEEMAPLGFVSCESVGIDVVPHKPEMDGTWLIKALDGDTFPKGTLELPEVLH